MRNGVASDRDVPIEGEVAAGFERVADVFRDNFTARGEIGASVCVIRDGKTVVDLWGGWADRSLRRPWQRDTVAILFSATKGLAAMTVLALADAGLIDYDRPVAAYWPAFAQAGKAAITVRMLMNHRAGLHALDAPLALADLDQSERVSAAIEAQRPLWPPGSDQGYHGVTYGLVVGELVRRVTGKRLGEVFAERITKPLGLDGDLWIGTPDSVASRVAALYPVDTKTRLLEVLPRLVTGRGHEGRVYRAFARRRSDTARAFANPPELGPRGIARFGTQDIRRRDMPWANGVGHARSLAGAYAGLLGDATRPPLVSRERLSEVFPRQSWTEMDRVILKPLGFSQGFLKDEAHMFSPDLTSFGHAGAGGILGWAVPSANLSIGYVMNRMDFRIRSPRALALAQAVAKSL